MKPYLAAPLLLALAFPCPAQDPPVVAPVYANAVISAPASVPAVGPLVVFGDESQSAKPLKWSLISPKGPFEVWDAPDDPKAGRKGSKGGLFVVRKPTPGVAYKLAAVATGDDGEVAFDFADIPASGPTPIPPPTPVPVPPPTPAPPAPVPVAKGWFATLIRPEGPPALLRSLAPLSESPTIGGTVAGLGGNWRVVDVGSAEFSRRRLDAAMLSPVDGGPVKPPCIVIQDAAGTVVRKPILDLTNATAPGAFEAAVADYLGAFAGGAK